MKRYLLVLFILSLALSACGATAPASENQPIDLTGDGSAVKFSSLDASNTGIKEVFVKRTDVDSKSTLLVTIDGGKPFLVTYYPYTVATGIKVLDSDTLEYNPSQWNVKAE